MGIKEKLIRGTIDTIFQEYGLTVRELQVIESMIEGHTSSKDLAKKLGITESTANNHIDNISKKTGLAGKVNFLSLVTRKLFDVLYEKGQKEQIRTVLIIDDEKELLEILKSEFEQRGYNTMTMSQVNDAAVELLDGVKLDLIVSDVVMPGMKGDEFLTKLRDRRGGLPATIFMSAYDSITRENVEKLGVYTLLKKPFPFTDLITSSEQALKAQTPG